MDELLQDLALQRRRLIELELTNKSLLGVIEDSADGIVVVDPEGKVIFANQATANILGRQKAEIIGLKFGTPLQNNDPMEMDMLTPTGERVPVELWSRPTQWEGAPAYRISVRNLSERKSAEQALRSSEASLVEAQSVAKIGSWAYDIAQDQVHWSREMFRVFDRDPALGEPSWLEHREHVHAEDCEHIESVVQQAIQEGHGYRVELRIVRRDGAISWVEAIGRAHRDEAGTITKLSGTVQDITARKLAEQSVAESEEKYRLLYRSIRDTILVIDIDRKIVDCNPEFTAVFGYALDEIKGRDTSMLYEKQEDFARMIREIEDHEPDQPFILTINFRRKDGSVFPGEISIYYLHDDQGQAEGVMGMVRDVSEKTAAEQALRGSLESLHQAEEIASLGYFERNWQTGEGYWSEGFFRLLGINAEKGVSTHQDFLKYLHPDDLERVRSHIQTSLAQHQSMNIEFRLVRKDNSVIRIKGIGRNMYDEEGKPLLTRGTFQDITVQKKAQEDVNRLAAIVGSSGDAIVGGDLHGIITSWNLAAQKIFGYSAREAIGKHVSLLVPEEQRGDVESHLERTRMGESLRIHQTVLRRKDGSLVHVSLSASLVKGDDGQAVGMASITRDISDLKKAEEEKERLEAQLRQSQKVEAIGTLAGGIAHDFNNILSIIMGYSELALDELTEGSPAAGYIKPAIEAANRAKELTHQILSFSRQTERQRSAMDPEPIIKEILKMLRSTLPSTIELKQSIPVGTGEVMSDPVQIQQILMNLCTNAAQAMEEAGGVLSVAMKVVEIDDLTANGYMGISPGRYQRLSVSDTGVGMEKDVLDRIFDPFFTTKEIGKGTGMGLSMVHGIVADSGGTITVYSEPGQGTTFHVYLPLVNGNSTKKPPPSSHDLPRGNETILFVDDEPTIVDIGKKTLSRLGYQVKGFTSARKAFEALKAAPEDFDLLITDYTMPGMTGVQLAKQVSAVKADMPIIICTGFAERLNAKSAQEINVSRLVNKPLAASEISRIVRKVLDRR